VSSLSVGVPSQKILLLFSSAPNPTAAPLILLLVNVQEAIQLYLEPVEDDLDFNPQAELLDITL